MSVRRIAQRGKQRFGSFLEEVLLAVSADLDKGDVGESGLPVRADRLDDRIEVRGARNGLGDVFRWHELGRAGETGRSRQVGVHLPATGEPAELIVCAFDGGV